MKIRTFVATTVAFVGIAISPNVYAAPATLHMPVHAMFGKTKMVNLSFRNDSSAPMELKIGENVTKLEAGKSVSVRVPVGTRILSNTETTHYKVGDLIEEASDFLNGSTIALK